MKNPKHNEFLQYLSIFGVFQPNYYFFRIEFFFQNTYLPTMVYAVMINIIINSLPMPIAHSLLALPCQASCDMYTCDIHYYTHMILRYCGYGTVLYGTVCTMFADRTAACTVCTAQQVHNVQYVQYVLFSMLHVQYVQYVQYVQHVQYAQYARM